jgi:hypothetical protein
VLGRDHDIDPADRLIRAWTAWENAPYATWTANAKEDAIHTAGLHGSDTHRHITTCRRHGMSIPDAVQTIVNDQRREAA